MIVTTPPRLHLALFFLVVFGVAGCASSGSAPEVSAEAALPPAPSPEATDSDPISPAPDDCIVGSWTLETASWDSALLDVVRADLSDAAVATTGTLTLDLAADQGYRVASVDFASVTTGSGNGGDLQWTVGFIGDETGTWYRLGDILILDPDASGRIGSLNHIEVDGVPLDDPAIDPDSTPWSDDLDIACDGSTLVLTPLNEPTAVPVVFGR